MCESQPNYISPKTDRWRRKGRPERRRFVEEEEGVPEDESLPHGGERHAPTRIGVGGRLRTQCKLSIKIQIV